MMNSSDQLYVVFSDDDQANQWDVCVMKRKVDLTRAYYCDIPLTPPIRKQEMVCIGSLETVERLLKAGADPNQSDRYGNIPLFHAINNEKWEVIEVLLKAGANPNQTNKGGDTPLCLCIRLTEYCFDIDIAKELLEVIEVLLKAGADPNQTDKCGDTPLCLCIRLTDNCFDIAKALLNGGQRKSKDFGVVSQNHLSADPNQPGMDGDTPLHIASRSGNLDVVKILLKAGGDPNQTDKYGDTPLHIASRSGNLDVVKILLKAGQRKYKDFGDPNQDESTEDSETLFNQACSMIVKFLKEWYSIS